jgi:sugar phosphate permease
MELLKYIAITLFALATGMMVLLRNPRLAGIGLGLNALVMALIALCLSLELLAAVWGLVGLTVISLSALGIERIRAQFSSADKPGRRYAAWAIAALVWIMLAPALVRGHLLSGPVTRSPGAQHVAPALVTLSIENPLAPAAWTLGLMLILLVVAITRSGGDD